MTITNGQILMVFPSPSEAIEVDADTTCPKCGVPWKEGASYGHNFCCGCEVCGYSLNVFSIQDWPLKEPNK